MKKRSGKRISGYSQPSSLSGFRYQDTVTATLTGTGSAETFVFSAQQLLPGLNDRTVVFKKIMIQIIPQSQGQNDNTVLAYWVPVNSNGVITPTAPFRLISAVNPTYIGVNVDKLKRLSPGVVITMSTESTAQVLGIRFGIPPLADTDYVVRITSIIHVFPQLVSSNPTAATAISHNTTNDRGEGQIEQKGCVICL